MAKCICDAVNAMVSYLLGGDLNPTNGQCKFLRIDSIRNKFWQKSICDAVNAIVSYLLGGDLNPTRGQYKFLRMDVNDSFQD